MAKVAVIGAGVGGLSTAMLLALDGHEVTVVERDPAPPPGDPHEAWETWERRGVNQFRLPHFLLARWRELADQELPEVVKALDDLGALRFQPTAALPAEVTGGRRDGDERFEAVTARRPVIEAAVAATAASTFGVTVRRGTGVRGLLTGAPRHDAVPHVTGLVTEGGEEIRADLVVDSSGRRSSLPSRLEAIGATGLVEEAEDCGFVYYGRHYRGDELPACRAGLLQHYESVSLLTLPADNGTWSVAFVTSARDRALRGLRDPARFDAALDLFALGAHWKAGTPLGGVDVMAKIEDRYRRFVVDGRPVVTGLVAVGDAWACTNPSLGRGISLGLQHGCELRDVLREVLPSDPVGLALRWHEVTEATVGALYRLTLDYDRHRLAEIDAEVVGRAYEPEDPMWPMVVAVENAAPRDPDLQRALLEAVNLLATPDEILARPGVFEAVLAAAEGVPRYPLPGPDRATLVATVAS